MIQEQLNNANNLFTKIKDCEKELQLTEKAISHSIRRLERGHIEIASFILNVDVESVIPVLELLRERNETVLIELKNQFANL